VLRQLEVAVSCVDCSDVLSVAFQLIVFVIEQ
jgi:hypothetical protein